MSQNLIARLAALQEITLGKEFLATYMVGTKWTPTSTMAYELVDGNGEPSRKMASANAMLNSSSSLPLPWELSASYVTLIGELLVGRPQHGTTNEPLPYELITTLVKGSALHGKGPSMIGLVQMLEYGESTAELGRRVLPDAALEAEPTALSRLFNWACELCCEPDMIFPRRLRCTIGLIVALS